LAQGGVAKIDRNPCDDAEDDGEATTEGGGGCADLDRDCAAEVAGEVVLQRE
jgi:hypothetical protein